MRALAHISTKGKWTCAMCIVSTVCANQHHSIALVTSSSSFVPFHSTVACAARFHNVLSTIEYLTLFSLIVFMFQNGNVTTVVHTAVGLLSMTLYIHYSQCGLFFSTRFLRQFFFMREKRCRVKLENVRLWATLAWIDKHFASKISR